MDKLICKIALISLSLFFFSNVIAQTEADTTKPAPTMLLKMMNGDEFKGQIIKQDNETIVLRTVNGDINLIAKNVASIEEYTYKGKFLFANPHDTRYFFGPSGIPIEKGKGYYQNVLVIFNFANYGITKNISIGGGFEFITTVSGEPVWFLTPKVGFELSENVHVAGGFLMAGLSTYGTATMGYGVITLGQSESNASLGIGYGFVDGSISDYPSIMIAGTQRVSNSIALLTENYVFPNSYSGPTYLGIHGIRILAKNNSFDFGIVIFPEIFDALPALPYVGYVRLF